MQRLVPLPTTYLEPPDALDHAADLVTWAQCFAVNLLTNPRPRWWVEMGLGDDFEDTAALNIVVQQSADCLSKLRAMKNGAPCQDAPQLSTGGDQPTQPEG